MARKRIFAKRSAPGGFGRLVRRVVVVALIAFVGGFLVFASSLHASPPPSPRADAIVALTGGAARLHVAIALLEAEAGDRLLISGVDTGTSRSDVRALVAAEARRFDCCVDLGWRALDTAGNASEAAEWARAKQYRSLIIVTANYHMPRALLELRAALPDVELIPFPVAPNSLDLGNWWTDPDVFRLVVAEYMKYLASWARLGAGSTFS